MKNITHDNDPCILLLDTETCNSLEEPLIYDFGGRVLNLRTLEIPEEVSYTIFDIYAGQRELMKTAYYAEKLPQYEIGMKNGLWKMKRFYNVRREVLSWFDKYNIIGVAAYNTKFDRRALNNTLRFLTDGKSRYFFPYGVKFYDIWTMAANTIFQTQTYRKMAYDNEWYSEKGNVRTTAEHAWRYLTKNADYDERHTALEDVKIEMEIMLHCWKKCTEEQREIVGNPWRVPQPYWYYTQAKKDGLI